MLGISSARRWVWNWASARRREHYAATGRFLKLKDLSAELTRLKREDKTRWLAEAHAAALQQGLRDHEVAYQRFFRARQQGDRSAKPPGFQKKKGSRATFRMPQRAGLDVAGNRVRCPKVGWMKARIHRPPVGAVGGATFTRNAEGWWHVSFPVEVSAPPRMPPTPTSVLGVDWGVANLATLSSGETVENPKFGKRAETELARAHRTLSRRQYGSGRWERARVRLARVYGKLKRRRTDYVHKLTDRLTREWDVIGVETIAAASLAKTKLAKAVQDATPSQLRRQLAYKCELRGKTLVAADRFYPSSRTCSSCGKVRDVLDLACRAWTCECGVKHDRDRNAAENLRAMALAAVTAGVAVRGADVRPDVSPAAGDEPCSLHGVSLCRELVGGL